MLAAHDVELDLGYLYAQRDVHSDRLARAPTPASGASGRAEIPLSTSWPMLRLSEEALERLRLPRDRRRARRQRRRAAPPRRAGSRWPSSRRHRRLRAERSGARRTRPRRSRSRRAALAERRSRSRCRAGAPVAADRGRRGGRALDGYLQTMERFLATNEQVMSAYLERRRGGRSSSRRGGRWSGRSSRWEPGARARGAAACVDPDRGPLPARPHARADRLAHRPGAARAGADAAGDEHRDPRRGGVLPAARAGRHRPARCARAPLAGVRRGARRRSRCARAVSPPRTAASACASSCATSATSSSRPSRWSRRPCCSRTAIPPAPAPLRGRRWTAAGRRAGHPSELYDEAMFHQPLWQGVRAVDAGRAGGARRTLEVLPRAGMLRDEQRARASCSTRWCSTRPAR